MMHKVFFVLSLVLLMSLPANAQSCADVNDDGHVNIADGVYMLNEHIGGPALLFGRGDIDYRQGYTAGDLRHLVDYIFMGGNVPGCPPFAPYTLTNTDDSIFLPSYVVPAGSGQFILPIYMVNHTRVGDIVLPMHVSGLGSGIFLDSLRRGSSVTSNLSIADVEGSTAVFATSAWQSSHAMNVGVNLLAEAYFHYVASPGGTVSMDTVTLRPHTFLNYIYSNSPNNYDVRTIGIPRIAVISGSTYPTMTVQPDSLFYQALAGTTDPEAQQITVSSSGALFAWTLTNTSWINVDASSGVSGQPINVTPNIAAMAVGVYYGEVVIYSTAALGSPRRVVVKLTLRPQFPSLDANCDGIFDISDVVATLQYMFSNGNLCNPCTGTWEKEKK